MTRYILVYNSKVFEVLNSEETPITDPRYILGISNSANVGDTVTVYPNLSVTVERVYIPKVILTRLEFLRRFTAEERINIRAATKVNPQIEDFMELLNLAQDIDLTDNTLQYGMLALVSAGLLTEERRGIIMA